MSHEQEMNWLRTIGTILTITTIVAVLSVVGVLMVLFLPRPGWAVTHYAGEWDHIDPAIRSWFKSIRSPNGVPCCDISDGHRTLEDWRGSDYWIPNPAALGDIEWMRVPPEAVVYDSKNPTGEAVVWYTMQSPGQVFVRCFVPGSGI